MKEIPDYFLNKGIEILKEKENGKYFCKIYYGINCYWYIKKNDNGNYDTFFIHSNDFLSYDDINKSNKLILLKDFLNGYIEISSHI